MSKRVALVLGGSGFLGSAAAAELAARGWDVVAARRDDADLEDAAAIARLVRKVSPEAIVQAAGTDKTASPARVWSALVGGTINVLEAAVALRRAPRVVVVGSAAEYGDAPSPSREDGPARPLNPYGSIKLAQTLAALSYRHQGVPVAVARVFNVCGPGCPERLVPGAFIDRLVAIERGAPPSLSTGDLSGARDFVDVRDAASALAELCEPRVPAGIYNACSGRAVKVGDVLRRLLALSNARVKVSSSSGGGGVKTSVGDARKLRRATGWKPRFSLDDSLRDALSAARLKQ